MPKELSHSAEQRETLERLRDEMEQAKALYDGARDAYELAKKQYADLSAKPLERASLVYDFTRQCYKCAIQRFNAFVLDGALP